MSLTPEDWHNRFAQQSSWTQDLRVHLFNKAAIEKAQLILDVGCGTGVILREMSQQFPASLHGLDINPIYLDFTRRNRFQGTLTLGDAHRLPYRDAIFDATFCHFLLMWVSEPLQVVREMARVTRPGGAVLALAEPDYGGRIDHPAGLVRLGQLQKEALRAQGSDPLMGRRLAGLFSKVGFTKVETGVLGGQWTNRPSNETEETEWSVIKSDLEYLNAITNDSKIEELRAQDIEAWAKGERVLYVPTFYAFGRL